MMPTPYTVDLHWRIVWLYTAKQLNPQEISMLVCVSQTIRCYSSSRLVMFSRSHSVIDQKLLGNFGQLVLLRLVLQNPGIYLHEIQDRLLARFGVTVSIATICRTLQFMGCTRQVIQHIPVQRSEELRAKIMARISMYDPSMLIWIDESGCDRRHCTRKWGYSLRGMPPRDYRILA